MGLIDGIVHDRVSGHVCLGLSRTCINFGNLRFTHPRGVIHGYVLGRVSLWFEWKIILLMEVIYMASWSVTWLILHGCVYLGGDGFLRPWLPCTFNVRDPIAPRSTQSHLTYTGNFAWPCSSGEFLSKELYCIHAWSCASHVNSFMSNYTDHDKDTCPRSFNRVMGRD